MDHVHALGGRMSRSMKLGNLFLRRQNKRPQPYPSPKPMPRVLVLVCANTSKSETTGTNHVNVDQLHNASRRLPFVPQRSSVFGWYMTSQAVALPLHSFPIDRLGNRRHIHWNYESLPPGIITPPRFVQWSPPGFSVRLHNSRPSSL